MHTLRFRLVLAFLAATLVPLAATIWIATSLLEHSLGYATTGQLDELSRTLEETVRQFYQRERESLKRDALAGRTQGTAYSSEAIATWPNAVRAFWASDEAERFELSGPGGSRLDYMRRSGRSVDLFSRDLGEIRMQTLSDAYRRARSVVDAIDARDLRRGFTLTLLLLVALVWLASLAPLLLLARRISRPIQALTDGLTGFAAGDWDRRLDPAGDDEVGRAIAAFNAMAGQLRRNRERLVYLTQIASWQSLARKTAHELKNSLTPIRLTVEEMLARQPVADRAFMEQAVQIVVAEIETLERRVRAFSEFSSEPPVDPEVFDVNALVAERVALSRPAHPGTVYSVRFDARTPKARAGIDLVKGILTNLLDNAADAAGPGGSVLTLTRGRDDAVVIEVHDSGPGLSADASRTLFEPTITFKKDGMGLGLSIARKNALLVGGDISLVPGELGGAGFSVVLPSASGSEAARAS